MPVLTRLAALILVALVAAPALSQTTQPSIEQLQRENQALRERVKELEKKLRAATTAQASTIPSPAPARPKTPFSIPDTTPPRGPFFRFGESLRSPTPESSLPKNWQEREFNGLKYYLVPLSALRR